MNTFYRCFLLSLLLGTLSGYGQTDINSLRATGGGYSTTYLTDYQCLGINPANVGIKVDNHTFYLGFLESGFSLYTNALTKHQVTHDLFNNDIELTLSEKASASEQFTDTRMWGQIAMTWLGFSYYNKVAGGFAISIRDRLFWNTIFNSYASQFIFLGYHSPYFDSIVATQTDTTGFSTDPQSISEVYNGTKAHFIWYREFNFGYGRQIFGNDMFEIYGGLGLKYIRAYGSFQFNIENGQLSAYSSLGPEFNIDYGAPTPSAISGSGVKKVGSGYGIDLGVTMRLLKMIKISLAVNDIGSINWNGNVYQVRDVAVYKISTGGINNYNIFNSGQLIKTDGLPSDSNTWEGVKSKRIGLPTVFRMGGSIRPIPQVEAGIDLIIPLKKDVPGSYDKEILGFGVHFTPAKWVDLSAGFVTGAKVGNSFPLGVTFFPVRNDKVSWELGLATRDLSIFLNGSDFMGSIAMGLVRVGF